MTVVLERLVVEPLGSDDGPGLGVDELPALKAVEREGDELAVTVTVVRELLPDVAVDEEGGEGPLEVDSTELVVEPCAEDWIVLELEDGARAEDVEETLAVLLEEIGAGVDERGVLDEVACAGLLVRAVVDDTGFTLD